MEYIPKKTKYKKNRKGKNLNLITTCYNIKKFNFGVIGLKVLEFGKIYSNQLIMLRQSINKIIKKSGKLIINKIAYKSITKKPIQARMGKGKGAVKQWALIVKPGMLLCEIDIKNFYKAKIALSRVQIKLPIKTVITFF
jgi:large subunit ribosomal protein L16